MDKKTIIFFVIVAVVVLLYPSYVRWVSPPPPPMPVDTTAAVVRDTTAPQPTIAAPESTLVASPLPEWVKTPATQERIVTVETDKFVARLSSKGAQLISLKLKPNGRYIKQETELLSRGEGSRPTTRFWTVDGPLEIGQLGFHIAGADSGETALRLTGSAKTTVRFVAPLDSARSLEVAYDFSGSDYTMLYHVNAAGLAANWVRDYAEVYWSGGLAYTEADTTQDHYYSLAYTFYKGDVLEQLKINAKKESTTTPSSGDTRWGAVRTKYFLAALIPDQMTATGAWMENKIDRGYSGRNPPNLLGVGLRIPLQQGSLATPIRMYLGPLDEDILNNVDPTLKRTMTWGWPIISIFSKAILWGLKAMHHAIPNYGICVIIFSVLIKIIVWPLTKKSYQSMAAMQLLQPKIQAMREKYKSDPQRVQKEMMRMYKEEKVNPMGGCLPILIQMPLLWALFIVFRTTIEFRQAGFGLWIHDLSNPDVIFHLPFAIPIYGAGVCLLPLLMGVSTFLQSKTQMITDPNQKFMLYFTPVFMTLIFNQFPSGLNLYYTLFNVWTLIQQKMTPKPVLASATTQM